MFISLTLGTNSIRGPGYAMGRWLGKNVNNGELNTCRTRDKSKEREYVYAGRMNKRCKTP